MSDTRQPTDTGPDSESTWIRQRLGALRNRYPGTALRTQLTHIHDDQVVVRAEVSLPDGSSVSAYAAEPSEQSGLLDGAIELAEGRAIARALDLLGLGDVQASATSPEPIVAAPPEPVAARPPDRSPPPVVDALRKASQRRPETGAPPPIDGARDEPRDAAPVASPSDPVPEVREVRQAPRRPEPATAPTQPEQPNNASEEPGLPELPDLPDLPDLADYTWTHFWTWARANDLSTKGQVEQRIGRPIDNLTPRDVRQLLHESGVIE